MPPPCVLALVGTNPSPVGSWLSPAAAAPTPRASAWPTAARGPRPDGHASPANHPARGAAAEPPATAPVLGGPLPDPPRARVGFLTGPGFGQPARGLGRRPRARSGVRVRRPRWPP